jgi:glycerophosphoryl diester phosphodiesterase
VANEVNTNPGVPDGDSPSTARFRPAGRPPTVFAHRGMSKLAPENTMAAFALVARQGIPGVELDIHQCTTGELMVAHDDTLSRTAGVDLDLRQATLGQIREHEVGAWFDPQFTGEKVPTLAEVFELLGDGVFYDIEIKASGTYWGPPAPDGPEATLEALIRKHGLVEKCLVSSFDPLALRRFSRLTGDIPIALIYSNSKGVPVTIRRGRGRLFCRPEILKPHHSVVTRAFVSRNHAGGRQVIPWTVDDPDLARRLVDAGVDGLISNVPDVISSAVT